MRVHGDRLGVVRVVGLADEDCPEPASVGLAVGDFGRIVDKLTAIRAGVGRLPRERAEGVLAVRLADDAEQPAGVHDGGVEFACAARCRRPAEYSIEETHGDRSIAERLPGVYVGDEGVRTRSVLGAGSTGTSPLPFACGSSTRLG